VDKSDPSAARNEGPHPVGKGEGVCGPNRADEADAWTNSSTLARLLLARKGEDDHVRRQPAHAARRAQPPLDRTIPFSFGRRASRYRFRDASITAIADTRRSLRHALSRRAAGGPDDCMARMMRKSNRARSTSDAALLLL
jgi:hypothetical protein